MGSSLTTQTSYSLPDYCLVDTMTLDQMQVSNSGAATLFQQNMLPMMSVLQFLFFALAPLAAAAMVLAGGQGVSMFLKYLTFGMWTQSWLPVAAVLNGYAQMSAQQELGRLALMASGVGATASTGDPLIQWANLSLVFHNVAQILSNAHMMLALTPVITMIVFTGSYMGMANLAQDITAQDKVDRNMGTVAPDLGAPNVAQQFGVTGMGASIVGGSAAIGAGASGLSMVASNVLGAGIEAAITQSAARASTYGQKISEMAKWAATHASEHNESFIDNLVNGKRGTFSQSTAMGQTYSALKSRGLSDAEAMSFTVGVTSAAVQAYKSGKQAGMGDAQATKMAEQAAQTFMDQAKKVGGAALSGALDGLKGGIETNIRDTLTNEQKRSDLFDAVKRTQAALDQYADSSFAHSTSQTEKHGITQMKEDAKQAAYSTDISANEAASLAKKTSEVASLGSGAKLTYAAALGELRNLAANGGPSVRQIAQDVLTRATQDNQAAADKALAIAAKLGYQGDEQMLYAAFLAASGKTEGVTAVGAAEASAALLKAVYGSTTGTNVLEDNQKTMTAATGQVEKARGEVNNGREGLKKADNQAGAAGNDAAENAGIAKQRPTPKTPTKTPEEVGGRAAQNRVWTEGTARADASVVPAVRNMKAHEDAVNQAAHNITETPLTNPVEFMARHPELTAAGITAANALAGALGAWTALQALNKVLQGGKGAAPGVPPTGGPSITPGGGGAAGRPGPTSTGKPGLPHGGGGGGSPQLGGPPNTAAVLDANGNVIGHTAISEAEQVAAKTGKPLASVLAEKALSMRGAALKVGSAVFRVLGGPVGTAAQLFTYSGELNAEEEAGGPREKRMVAIARLSEKDPSFQKDSELVKQAVASGKQNDPEVKAAYDRIQAKIAEEEKRAQ
jgi:conjugal transfer mating pair stabilization protein TraG